MSASHIEVRQVQFRRVADFWREAEAPDEPIRGQNISSAGAHNRQLLLHHIRAKGPISRLDLSLLTGLTQPAVFKIAKDLLQEGWISHTLVRDGSRGQPLSLLSINPDAAFSIGLNVDRDHIAYVVLDFGGNVRESRRQDIRYPSPTDVKELLAKFYKASLRKYSTRKNDFVGIGLSIPEDFAKNSDPNLGKLWRAVSLEGLFADITPLPMILENDAAAAAIGEMEFGAGLEVNTFFYLYISVGLGGGLVVNRHYVRGRHGRSGELSFLPKVNPFKSSQTTLAKPVEEIVSVEGFLAAFRAAGLPAEGVNDVDLDDPQVQEVLEDWLQSAADLLYLPLLSTVCVIDPDAVFIGGHLPRPVTQRLAVEVSKRLSLNLGVNWSENAVRPCKVTQNAAAVGAGVIAFRDRWDRDLRE